MRDEKIDPRDAFGLIRSFLRHRAFVAEGLALVTNELERPTISAVALSSGGKTVTIDKAAAERITANVDAALRS